MDSSEIRPVYVYGVPWSGTTILYRFLAFHPDVAWLSQYSQRDGSIPERRSLPLAHTADRALRALSPQRWRKETRPMRTFWDVRGLRGRILPWPIEGPSIIDHVRAAPNEADAVARIRRLVESECRRWGKNVFLWKPLPLQGELHLLEKAHPNACMIQSVRDGRAVAATTRGRFMKSGESAAEGIEKAAEHWVELIDEVERLEMPTLTIRYEDLCVDVHAAVRQALDHAGLDAGVFPFEHVPTTLTVTNERRIANLTPGELEMVQGTQAPRLQALGYLDA